MLTWALANTEEIFSAPQVAWVGFCAIHPTSTKVQTWLVVHMVTVYHAFRSNLPTPKAEIATLISCIADDFVLKEQRRRPKYDTVEWLLAIM